MTKNKNKIVKFTISIAVIILVVFISLFSVLYLNFADAYSLMNEYDIGYSNGDNIIIEDKTYSFNCPYDLNGYVWKNDEPEKFYHIITSNFKPLAILRDFVVGVYADDPNGYIISEQKDTWGFSGVDYYSTDFKLPNVEIDEIRQIFITFSPIEKPSAGYTYSISDEQAVKEIIKCIKNEESPECQIEDANIKFLSDNYKIWVDYYSFPMYQMIYSK